MYIIFILFFSSLAGIIIMVGRKLTPVRNGKVIGSEQHPLIPDLQKIKHFSYRSFKKYEHLTLVTVLRFYVRFSNFVKHTYEELKTKITNIRKLRNGDTGEAPENKEPSKFLKIISEYKQKVIHIKHRITEEEENK